MGRVDNKEFLWYGLYAFAGFGLELLLIMVENMFIIEETLFSDCLHWVLTSILWGLMGFVLYKNSKNKLNYDIKNNNKIETKNIIISLILAVVVLVIKYFVVGGIKPIMEFNNLGAVRFVFQYIYYLFEVILIILTIAFGQKFFEVAGDGKNAAKYKIKAETGHTSDNRIVNETKNKIKSETVSEIENKTENKVVPYGGLFLACTWGLIHILTQDFSTGVYAFLVAIVYGVIYLLLNKNTRWAYLGILVLFVM